MYDEIAVRRCENMVEKLTMSSDKSSSVLDGCNIAFLMLLYVNLPDAKIMEI